jgi:hypothetical protein
MRVPFSVCCVHLAVLGTVGGGLASSAYEWLLQRLGAVIAQRAIAAVALGRCVLRPWHLVSLGTLVKRQAAWANGVADGGATGKRRAMLRLARPTTPPLISRNTASNNRQGRRTKCESRTKWLLRPRANPTPVSRGSLGSAGMFVLAEAVVLLLTTCGVRFLLLVFTR